MQGIACKTRSQRALQSLGRRKLTILSPFRSSKKAPQPRIFAPHPRRALDTRSGMDDPCTVVTLKKGRIMKRTGFALAFVAAIAMTVTPVAPSFAAAPKQQTSTNQALAEHAGRGDVVVLSPAQMNELAV